MDPITSIAEIGKLAWLLVSEECKVAGTVFALLVLAFSLLRGGWRRWPEQAFRSCVTNLSLMLSNNYFGQLAILLMIWAQASYNHFGFPHLDTEIWSSVPSWLMALIALLAMDFADYWCHRILHTKWFWPIHSIHHSDTHVTVLTTARVHFLESFAMKLTYIVLLGWLGFPPGVLGGVSALLLIHNMYTHIDVDWGHGPLKYLLASPRYHRWHHANAPEAFNKNLANVFPFYDVLFGTYYVPGTCHSQMGADGVPTDNVIALITWPITEWLRLAGGWVAKGTPDNPSLEPQGEWAVGSSGGPHIVLAASPGQPTQAP